MHTTILAEAGASGPSAALEVVTMVMLVDSVIVTAGSVVTEMDTEGTTADEDSRELFRIMMDHHINASNT